MDAPPAPSACGRRTPLARSAPACVRHTSTGAPALSGKDAGLEVPLVVVSGSTELPRPACCIGCTLAQCLAYLTGACEFNDGRVTALSALACLRLQPKRRILSSPCRANPRGARPRGDLSPAEGPVGRGDAHRPGHRDGHLHPRGLPHAAWSRRRSRVPSMRFGTGDPRALGIAVRHLRFRREPAPNQALAQRLQETQ